MKEIKLTKGQVALVSDHRFEELNQFKWQATWSPTTGNFYATRSEYLGMVNGKSKQTTIQMSRQILGLKYGDPRQGDHENLNTLDNQDHNLRIATGSQNQANRRGYSRSGFKGVYIQSSGNYQAALNIEGKWKHLGTRKFPEEAHELYCNEVKKIYGEFARC